MTRLPKGTRVRLRTVGGADGEMELFSDYVPTYGAWFRIVRDDGTVHDRAVHFAADRIASVDALEPDPVGG